MGLAMRVSAGVVTAVLVLTSLALAACAGDAEEDATAGVYVVRIVGDPPIRRADSEEEQLVPVDHTFFGTSCAGGGGTGSVSSPDGSARAAVRSDHAVSADGLAEDTVSLLVVDANGERRTYGRWAYVDGFAWSPDSRRIAISADGRIWVAEPDRAGLRRATRPGYWYEDICPVWLDRRTYAFYRARMAALP